MHALLYVRSVVPNAGIVMAWMPLLSIPRRSNAFAVTSSASVESRPPEMPMTAVFAPICSSLFLSPSACRRKISSQRAVLSSDADGTNGLGSNLRVSAVSAASRSKIVDVNSPAKRLSYVVMRLLSARSLSTSISPYVTPVVNRPESARSAPFSAIIRCPQKTRSWEDSPSPALA